MDKSIYVTDLAPGDTVAEETFLLADVRRGQARNGPYVKLVLQDATGRLDGVVWSPLAESCQDLATGDLVRLSGAVTSFQNASQVRVERIRTLAPEEHDGDLTPYLPSANQAPEDMFEAIDNLVLEHIEHKPLRTLVRKILSDKDIRPRLLAAPGAKTVHHAYVGGLLEHTLAVARLCLEACRVHAHLDRQILLAGAVLHDLGKAWELTSELACDYTDEGRLLGHVNLSLEVLEPFLAKAKDLEPEIKLHLKHLVVSHHGEHEFGAAVRPKTPEAFVLHFMDNLDSKLNQAAGPLSELEDGAASRWTPFQRFLDRQLYKADRVPSKADPDNKRSAPENQCSLPLKG